MKFYIHKKEKNIKVMIFIALCVFLFVTNNFRIDLYTASIFMIALLLLVHKLMDNTEYEIVGSTIELNTRKDKNILDIHKIERIEKYNLVYGLAGGQQKSRYFIKYDGNLIRIKTNVKNDNNRNLTEVLNMKYSITIVEK